MATLTITAADIGIGSNATVEKITVGQATGHGIPLYYDSADSLWKTADADVLATANAAMISVTSATASGQSVMAVSSGQIRMGAILTSGVEYYLHTTAGLIGLKSDITTGDYVTRIGIATSTSTLEVRFHASGVVI